MTGATVDEAQAVITRLRAESKRLTGRDIGSVRHYIDAFEPEDLTPHLDAVRAQRASEGRTRASQNAGPDTRCGTHHEALPCGGCKGSPRPILTALLKQYGPLRRPDLKELVGSR